MDIVEKTTSDNIVVKREDLEFILDNYREMINHCGLDPLTSLISSGKAIEQFSSFYLEAYEKITESKNKEKKFAFFTFDADNFQYGNTIHGHYFMDSVLKHIGQVIKNNIRKKDLGIRLGGEEFAVVCEIPDYKIALKKAINIKNKIAKKVFNNGYKQTMSGGIYLFNIIQDESNEQLAFILKKYEHLFNTGKMQRHKIYKERSKEIANFILPIFIKARESSDDALYKAKATGKNKICIYCEDEDFIKYRKKYNETKYSRTKF